MSKPAPAKLWVVESYWEHRGFWSPTVATDIHRGVACLKLRDWRKINPGGKFRLRRYVPAPDPREGGQG